MTRVFKSHDYNPLILRLCVVQKDPEKERWLHEHSAHQQPSQIQEGEGDLPAGRIPDALRTARTGKNQHAQLYSVNRCDQGSTPGWVLKKSLQLGLNSTEWNQFRANVEPGLVEVNGGMLCHVNVCVTMSTIPLCSCKTANWILYWKINFKITNSVGN